MTEGTVEYTFARAVRLQKMVNAETACNVLADEIAQMHGAPVTLAKALAEAALAGDYDLAKSILEPLEKASKKKVTKLDVEKSGFQMAGGSALPVYKVEHTVSATDGKANAPHTEDLVVAGDHKLEKSSSSTPKDTIAHPDLKKAYEEVQKFLPSNCGHCNNACSCGRGHLKMALGMFKAEDAPPGGKPDAKPKTDGESIPDGAMSEKAPVADPLPSAADEAPGVGAGAVAPGLESEVVAPGHMEASAALQQAAQIADAVEQVKQLVTGLGGGAGGMPGSAPGMPPAPPVSPGAQFAPAPEGGVTGAHLEPEGGGNPGPDEGITRTRNSLAKALLNGKYGAELTKSVNIEGAPGDDTPKEQARRQMQQEQTPKFNGKPVPSPMAAGAMMPPPAPIAASASRLEKALKSSKYGSDFQ